MRGLHVDGPLLIGLMLVCGLGMVVLYSAGGQDSSLIVRQVTRLAVAMGAMLLIAQVPPNYLRMWAPWLFLAGTALLVAVLVTGQIGKGAQRWLNLGFFRFQPSELMKLGVPMMAAWFLHRRRLPPSLTELLVLAVIVLVPTLLIARQPDLGTSLLIASSGIFVVLLAGLRFRMMLSLAIMALGALPLLWHFMRDYQRQRVLTLLNPESDPLGSGYHIIQSKIAIGSGGVFGKGWLNGSQAKLEFQIRRRTQWR
ncbi:MAG: rod shape-determining protein RodA, partial [Chromatiales bacterium]|nr:rod shape-determining protein RodA [Chromatiales bacterium]